MLWGLFVLLVVLWVLGFFLKLVAGVGIHLLLVLAVIILLIKLLGGRRRA